MWVIRGVICEWPCQKKRPRSKKSGNSSAKRISTVDRRQAEPSREAGGMGPRTTRHRYRKDLRLRGLRSVSQWTPQKKWGPS